MVSAQQFGVRSPSLPRHANSDDVMSPAPRVNTSGFKMGDDSPLVAGSKSAALGFRIFWIRPLPHVRILKDWAGFDDITHLPGVVIPVGCKTPHSPIAEHSGNLECEGIADEAALAVARFSPRVREEGPDLVKAGIPQHDRERLRNIGLENSNIVDAGFYSL